MQSGWIRKRLEGHGESTMSLPLRRQRSNWERLGAEGISIGTLRWGVSIGCRGQLRGQWGWSWRELGWAGQGQGFLEGLTGHPEDLSFSLSLFLVTSLQPSDGLLSCHSIITCCIHFHQYFYFYCRYSEKQEILFVRQSLFLVYIVGIGVYVSVLPCSIWH